MDHRHLLRPRARLLALGLLLAALGTPAPAAASAGFGSGLGAMTFPGRLADADADADGSPVSTFADDPLVLATAAVRDGAPVDGIPAGPMVAGGYHVHAHLAVYVGGALAWVPAGIGVTRPVVLDPDRRDPVITAAMGYYSLHTHDESGVVHGEAPEEHRFTLGQFFDIWGQPLSRHQVGPAKGDVTVLVDGKRFDGDPRDVVIADHAVIQLNVGRDVAFQPYRFPSNY